MEYLWEIIVLDRTFNENPLFLSLNCIERSKAAISLKNKLKSHPQQSQLTFTCSKSTTIETVEKGVKYV